jgi:multisubunit Na+/H+ antiporter MnhF subunit
MEILLISEYFLLVALVIFLISSMRVISYKSVAMGLIGTSSLTLAVTIILVVAGTVLGLGFFKDIALALLLLGVVGTIGFAMVFRRQD